MNVSFDGFRVQDNHKPYPPYHTGLYLEDYFYEYYHIKNRVDRVDREYIPVTWTANYNNRNTAGLQDRLNQLDRGGKYFTVSQHDDAVRETLPPETICFNAGGNNGGIPIPLVCSSIPNEYKPQETEYLCSFVGSLTHPIRQKMYDALQDKPDCMLWSKRWNPEVHETEQDLFLESAAKSKFLLCPRGYGLNSFRLYEAFQLGCVPVIITDNFFLPWKDELDWHKFSVLISEDNVGNIYNSLAEMSEETYNKLLNTGAGIYSNYFTLESTCYQIIKRLLYFKEFK